jgi:hypothetical protein
MNSAGAHRAALHRILWPFAYMHLLEWRSRSAAAAKRPMQPPAIRTDLPSRRAGRFLYPCARPAPAALPPMRAPAAAPTAVPTAALMGDAVGRPVGVLPPTPSSNIAAIGIVDLELIPGPGAAGQDHHVRSAGTMRRSGGTSDGADPEAFSTGPRREASAAGGTGAAAARCLRRDRGAAVGVGLAGAPGRHWAPLVSSRFAHSFTCG